MFQSREHLYTKLAAMTRSGIPIKDAFSSIAASSSGKHKTGFEAAKRSLEKGGDLRDAVVDSQLFTDFEIELMLAGEKAGKLPETFQDLHDEFKRRREDLMGAAFALAYPMFLIHAALFLPYLAIIFQKGLGAFLQTIAFNFGVLYTILGVPTVLYFILKRSGSSAMALDFMIIKVPFIGTATLKKDLSRSMNVIGQLYSSGTNIPYAVQMGSEVSKLIPVKQLWKRVSVQLNQGKNLTEAIVDEALLPSAILEFLSTGESSGQLDDMFQRSADILREEAAMSMKIFLGILTALAFMVAVGLVAYKIISFWTGYIGKINKIR